MANIFENIAQTITAPVGGLIRGGLRGLDPGSAEAHDLRKLQQKISVRENFSWQQAKNTQNNREHCAVHARANLLL